MWESFVDTKILNFNFITSTNNNSYNKVYVEYTYFRLKKFHFGTSLKNAVGMS